MEVRWSCAWVRGCRVGKDAGSHPRRLPKRGRQLGQRSRLHKEFVGAPQPITAKELVHYAVPSRRAASRASPMRARVATVAIGRPSSRAISSTLRPCQ